MRSGQLLNQWYWFAKSSRIHGNQLFSDLGHPRFVCFFARLAVARTQSHWQTGFVDIAESGQINVDGMREPCAPLTHLGATHERNGVKTLAGIVMIDPLLSAARLSGDSRVASCQHVDGSSSQSD